MSKEHNQFKDFITAQTENIDAIIGLEEFRSNSKGLDKNNLVLIAILDPDSEAHELDLIDGYKDVLQIRFWDVEEGIGKYTPITDKQGKELKEFILKNKGSKFLIHCTAGVSRSAGVGMALDCLLSHNGDRYDYSLFPNPITNHYRYRPNYIVFDTVLGKNKVGYNHEHS